MSCCVGIGSLHELSLVSMMLMNGIDRASPNSPYHYITIPNKITTSKIKPIVTVETGVNLQEIAKLPRTVIPNM